MPRPLSQLVHTLVQPGAGSPRIITLHRHNQRARDVAPYALAASPAARITALESYKGVYLGRQVTGYTWFIGPETQPSPLYFGDALAEIERFLWDELDRQGSDEVALPFLLGVGQGAIMALAAAAAVPDLLSGVIAVEGLFPTVPGWSPPLVPLDDLPVLLLDAPLDAALPRGVHAGAGLATLIAGWGGRVAREPIAAGEIPGAAMAGWIARQPTRRRPMER